MYKYLVPAILGASALFILSPERAVERQPASGPMGASPTPTPDKIIVQQTEHPLIEVFEFDRRVKATLPNKEILADAHFSGMFIINWKEKNQGLFTFSADKAVPVTIAATISDQHELLEMKAETPTTEEEENSLLFLKDIISIYAFNTNEDTTGKYLSEIKETGKQGNASNWMKKKLKYSSDELFLIRFNRSIHEIQLVNNSMQEASGIEEVQMDMKNAAGSELSSTSGYVLKKIPLDDAKKMGLNLKVPVLSSTITPLTLKTTLKVTGKKVNWDQFRARLATADQLKGQKRVLFFHDCIKALKDHPEKLQEWLSWMHDKKSKERYELGISTLATVGTPAAQAALVVEFQKNPSHLILNALATTEAKLTDETRDYLRDFINDTDHDADLVANAAYTLGAAKNEKDVKTLGDHSLEASSITEKKIYLDALGNNGNSTILPYILDHLKSEDPSIREKAVFSLRFVNDSQVKSIFERSIQDPNANVRLAVVKAIPFQSEPHRYDSLLSTCAQNSTDQSLRPVCAQTLEDI